MKKHEETESSNEEDNYNEYLKNPQKRKQFDIVRLYQQQRELQKMSGYNNQISFEIPTKMNDQSQQKTYATVALCGLTVTNPFRDAIIRLVLNPWFDRIILLVIVGNCILLAIDNPGVDQLYYQMVADYLLLSIYTLEMILKIIAMGFVLRPYTYLRDYWNIMDFCVVMMGWLSKAFTSNNVQAIRVIRILRPLRTINSFTGMRTLVQSLLTSLPAVLDVYILFLFFLIMFGTIGNQLFSGLFIRRCKGQYGDISWDSDGYETMCQTDQDCVQATGTNLYTCQMAKNPNYGVTNFDNIFYSTLQVFIIITLEGWTEIMYFARKATGTYGYDVYFLMTVIVGTFFMLNLMVAVQFKYLSDAFNSIEIQDRERQQRAQQNTASQQSPSPTLGDDKEKQENDNVAELQNFEDAFNQATSKIVVKDEKEQDNKSPISNQKEEENNNGNQSSIISSSKNEQKNEAENANEKSNKSVAVVNNQTPKVRASVRVKSNKEQMQKNKNSKCRKYCACYFISSTKLAKLLESKQFNLFIIILILTNTIVLSVDHYGESARMEKRLDIVNKVFTVIFTIEMVIKIYGLGFKKYVLDGFNDFDAVIVVVGLLEFFKVGSKAVLVVRCFRLLRIFKIVRAWENLRKLLNTMLAAFTIIANLGLLMCLLVFIYALIGMQFLAGETPEFYSSPTQFNYDSFQWSLITVFILITDENWNSILYSYFGAKGPWVTIYFITIILIGSMMLLDLFLAVMLNFIQDEYIEEAQLEQSMKDQSQIQIDDGEMNLFDSINIKNKSNLASQDPTLQQLQQNQIVQVNRKDSQGQIGDKSQLGAEVQEHSHMMNNKSDDGENGQGDQIQGFKEALQAAKEQQLEISNMKYLRSIQEHNNRASESFKSKMSSSKSTIQVRKTKNSFNNFVLEGRSLFIFRQDNKFRKFFKQILENPYFDNMIYHLIALNTILLALDMPILSDPYQKQTIKMLTNIISGIFIGEAVFKIIVQGFVLSKGSYLREPWNILDFLIVLLTIVNWVLQVFSTVNINYLRALRSLRALRPLRMVSRNEGMRLVVNSLLRAIPTLLNVMLICLLFYLVFGILTVQLFKGQMSSCNDESIQFKTDCVGIYYDQDSLGFVDRQWIVPFKNYDNLLHAMITWYEVSTFENWPDILFKTINSVGFDQGPKTNNKTWAAIIFIAFIFITNFFVTNLFVSVIVDRFNEEIKKNQGSHDFTDEQKEWVKMQRLMVNINVIIRPIAPKMRVRRWCYVLVRYKQFEFFILFVIVINTLFLCMTYFNQPGLYNQILNIGNIIFVAIYTAEAVLKILAYGPKYYWYETWNKFDFIIVIVSLISLDQSLFSFNLTALRIIRVARLLRMVKVSKGLRHLLKTLWLSLGNVINVACLLFLIILMFSIAGMDLFGQMAYTSNITVNANFETFYMSFSLLIRAATGENWNEVMHDSFPTVGWLAVFYWCFFELLTNFVFLNVFVAVIYESFSEIMSSEDQNEILSLRRKDMKGFIKTWAKFNPSGSYYMKTKSFPAFLQELPPPLGYGGISIEYNKLLKIIFCLNIKDHQGKVYFPEVMWAIFHSIVGNNDEKVHKCQQVRLIMKNVKTKYKGLPNSTTPDSLCGNRFYKTEITVSKYLCAMQIITVWRKNKAQNQQANLKNEGQTLNLENNKQDILDNDQKREDQIRKTSRDHDNSHNWEKDFVKKNTTNIHLLNPQNDHSPNDEQCSESYDVNQDYKSRHVSDNENDDQDEEEKKDGVKVDSIEVEVEADKGNQEQNNISFEESEDSQSSINSEQISSSCEKNQHLLYQEKKIDFQSFKGAPPQLKRKSSVQNDKAVAKDEAFEESVGSEGSQDNKTRVVMQFEKNDNNIINKQKSRKGSLIDKANQKKGNHSK